MSVGLKGVEIDRLSDFRKLTASATYLLHSGTFFRMKFTESLSTTVLVLTLSHRRFWCRLTHTDCENAL
jgi:hypothetical protein